MENIESSWNILMDINFKILQSKYFNDLFRLQSCQSEKFDLYCTLQTCMEEHFASHTPCFFFQIKYSDINCNFVDDNCHAWQNNLLSGPREQDSPQHQTTKRSINIYALHTQKYFTPNVKGSNCSQYASYRTRQLCMKVKLKWIYNNTFHLITESVCGYIYVLLKH